MRDSTTARFLLGCASMNHRDAEAYHRAETRRRCVGAPRQPARAEGSAVVSVPRRGLLPIEAAVESHRRISRLTSDEMRRWQRTEPARPRDDPRPTAIPIARYLADRRPATTTTR